MNIIDLEYNEDKIHNEMVAKILEGEVRYFKSILKPEDCGHIHTTIRVLEDRIKQLRGQK